MPTRKSCDSRARLSSSARYQRDSVNAYIDSYAELQFSICQMCIIGGDGSGSFCPPMIDCEPHAAMSFQCFFVFSSRFFLPVKNSSFLPGLIANLSRR